MNKISNMILMNLFVISLFTNHKNIHDKPILYFENDPSSSVKIYDDYIIEGNSNISSRSISDGFVPITPNLPLSTHSYSTNKTFSKFYFSNLLNNLPANYDGICGYTAISMLMSYYDTYWNNNFIDNVYSNNQQTPYITDLNDMVNTYDSPGVRDQYISLSNYVSDNFSDAQKENGILNWIDANKNAGTFLGFLLDLSVTEGIQKTNYYNTGSYLTKIGVNYDIMVGLLTEYVNTLTFEDVSIIELGSLPAISNLSIRDQIIHYLNMGIPLCVGGSSYKDVNGNNSYDEDLDIKTGHEVVAYEYDESTNKIYCHLGWKSRMGTIRAGYANSYQSNFLRADLDSYFNLSIVDYCGINIVNNSSIAHVHNKSYNNLNSTTNLSTNVCACELDSHVHNYIYRHNNNPTNHTKHCYCSQVPIFDTHSFYYNIIDGQYVKICGECNYLEEV